MPATDSSSTSHDPRPDLLVVGAGIVGLAHAAEAVLRGLGVTVVERDDRAVGASIRNFGHICTTPQSGTALDLALVARESWLRLAAKAGFTAQEVGTVVIARTPGEQAVLEEFAADRGDDQVRLLTPEQVRRHVPAVADEVVAGAHLPLDLRVDPREAVPALAAWLAAEGVDFRWGTSVGAIEPGRVLTSRGELAPSYSVLAAGHDVDRLFPAIAAEIGLQRCRLQMFEVTAPHQVRIAPAVLTGSSMLRYAGLSAMPSAETVREELRESTPAFLEQDVNLMLTQRPDGAIVLGDTHHYATTHTPFEEESVAALILDEGARLLGVGQGGTSGLTVLRRWRGVYAKSPQTDFLIATPHAGTRVVSVTSGIGMTTALGLAPRVLDDLL